MTDGAIYCVSSSKYPPCSKGEISTFNNAIFTGPSLPPSTGATTTDTVAIFRGSIDVEGVIDPEGVVYTELSAPPLTSVAGKGQVWIRNDTPNVLMYTDDEGTDFNLLEAASTSVSLTSGVGDESLVIDGTGPDLSIKSLTAGTNISLASGGSDLTINNTGSNIKRIHDSSVSFSAGTNMTSGGVINVTGWRDDNSKTVVLFFIRTGSSGTAVAGVDNFFSFTIDYSSINGLTDLTGANNIAGTTSGYIDNTEVWNGLIMDNISTQIVAQCTYSSLGSGAIFPNGQFILSNFST